MLQIAIISGLLMLLAFTLFVIMYMQKRLYQGTEKQKNHQRVDQETKKQKHTQAERQPSKPINWRVLLSDEIQRYLPDHNAYAITRYRQLTDANEQEAARIIEYHIAYPNQIPAHFRHYELTDEQILSLHKMLRQGKRTEAHRKYQNITGVDQFAADVGLDILEQQVLITDQQFATIRDIADVPSEQVKRRYPSMGKL